MDKDWCWRCNLCGGWFRNHHRYELHMKNAHSQVEQNNAAPLVIRGDSDIPARDQPGTSPTSPAGAAPSEKHSDAGAAAALYAKLYHEERRKSEQLERELASAIERERLANMRADQAEEARDAAVSASGATYDPVSGHCTGECDCQLGQTCKAYLAYRRRVDRTKAGDQK